MQNHYEGASIMPKSVGNAGTPFKQILIGGQRTTESPRSNNSHLHRFAQSAAEKTRSNNTHIHRFALSATEIREGRGRASAGRVSRSGSRTASMRSSSASSYTSLDRLGRQKGCNTIKTVQTWITNWLYPSSTEKDIDNISTLADKPDEPSTKTDDKPDEPSTTADKPDEPSTTADKPDESK